MVRSLLTAGLALTAIGLAGSASAAQQQAAAPNLGTQQVQAAAHPYDEAADGHKAIGDALAEAKATGKKVLVDFGANWCPDCRALGGVMELAPVKAYVDAHYVTAVIDVGRFNKNLDIPEAYGVKLHGIPSVFVLDTDGKLLNRADIEALGDARTMTPQAVVDQLAHWTEQTGS